MILTATGLVFVTAADRKVHVYDSEHRQADLGAAARRGDQRRAVDVRARRAGSTCSSPRLPRARGGPGTPPAGTSPAGIVAYALPRK